MGNVQISQELFMQLIRFHLVEDESCEKEIKKGLEKKLDKMVMRDLYGKFKTAPTEEERERRKKSIWTDEECRRVSVGNSSLMISTGAWHAPVDSRQGETWKGELCNERRKIRL